MATIPTRTERLLLAEPTGDEVNELHLIEADSGAWQHLPQGVHTDLAQTEALLGFFRDSWAQTGLGSWVARLAQPLGRLPAGTIVGSGGVSGILGNLPGGAWNLGYRFSRSVWGNGLATELCRAALDAAALVSPDRPVTARVLERNPASFRVLEKVGLKLIWRGDAPSAAVDPELRAGVLRRVYADRPLRPELLAELVAKG